MYTKSSEVYTLTIETKCII